MQRIGRHFRRWCSAGAEKERFFNANPYKVLGISDSADKKAAKRAYYALAMKYHPDNAAHGDRDIMNLLNSAYAKIARSEYAESQVEFENIRTAGMSYQEKAKTYEQTHKSSTSAEDRKKWDERAEARDEARRRMLRKRKPHKGKGKVDDRFREVTGGGTMDRCRQRDDGKWVFRIRGEPYIGDRYIAPLHLNYRLLRAGYSTAEFEKLGLTKMDITDSENRVHKREERAHVERTIPLLHDAETRNRRESKLGVVWRERYVLELFLVASLATYWLYRFAAYVVKASQVGVANVHSEDGYALQLLRESRKERADALLAHLEERLQQEAETLQKLSAIAQPTQEHRSSSEG